MDEVFMLLDGLDYARNTRNWSMDDVGHDTYAGNLGDTVNDMLQYLDDPFTSLEIFVGNTVDYVNEAAYETVLQNLAERDLGSRGAPPASKSAVKNLENVVIEKNDEEPMTCPVCQEIVNVGEGAKRLQCKHVYHDECITTWLCSRNSCPVCRFELPTDDEEYENNKRKRRKLENSVFV